MRNTRTITVSIDENRLIVLTELVKKIKGNVSGAFDFAIILMLNHIGYNEKTFETPEDALGLLTNLKSVLDNVPYTREEVLSMLKDGTIQENKLKLQKHKILDKIEDLDRDVELQSIIQEAHNLNPIKYPHYNKKGEK